MLVGSLDIDDGAAGSVAVVVVTAGIVVVVVSTGGVVVADTVDTVATGGRESPPAAMEDFVWGATDVVNVADVTCGPGAVPVTWGVIGPRPHPMSTARPTPITADADSLAETCIACPHCCSRAESKSGLGRAQRHEYRTTQSVRNRMVTSAAEEASRTFQPGH